VKGRKKERVSLSSLKRYEAETVWPRCVGLDQGKRRKRPARRKRKVGRRESKGERENGPGKGEPREGLGFYFAKHFS
jgi:hypothetical protein